MPTVSDYTALLSGDYWGGIETTGRPVIVTYSFPTAAPAYDAGVQGFTAATLTSFQAFNAAEQGQARAALGEWAAASGIIFVEVAPGQGDINFQLVDLTTSSYGNPGGIGFYPFGNWDYFTYPSFSSDLDSSGDVFMNTAQVSGGKVNYGTLLHEIGHAIGLKHPTEVVYSPGAGHDQVLDTGNDPTRTIMATVGDPAITDPHLLTLDKNAAAFIYGATGGQVVTASTSGTNAVSAWSWNAGTQVLTQTAVAGGETIRGSSVNDVITAVSGNNRLFGLNGNDTLNGGAGNDYLDGGVGVDTMTGGGGDDIYTVDNSADQIIELPGGGYDTVYAHASFVMAANVEQISVYGQGLTATGNDLGNTMYGDGYYATTLNGMVGQDYIVAGRNNDTVNGGSENDLLYGSAGNDTLIGGTGNDLLNGGTGFDTADYSSDDSSTARTINLITGTATSFTETDTLVSIEHVRAGSASDTIIAAPGVSFTQPDLVKSAATHNLNVDNAVDLDAWFRIKSDGAVPNSATVPHATVNASTVGESEFYAFSVVDPGGVVTIQVASTGAPFTPFVSIFSADGTRLAAQAMPSGSTTLSYTFAASGEYIIAVQDSTLNPNGDHNPVPAGDTYTLQVALTNPVNAWLEGGGGNDLLRANSGWERLDGGTGNDTVSFANLGFGVSANLATGVGAGSNGQYQLISIENLTGSAYADVLTGDANANMLNDGGGAGVDTLIGGAGNDTYYVGNGGDTVTEAAGEGTNDQIVFTVGGALGTLAGVTGVEQFGLSGAGNSLTLVDSTFANVTGSRIAVNGGAGSDTVDGSALSGTNAITVTAGAGNDTLKGGAGNDIFRFNVGDLTAADVVQGGGGTDTLVILTAGTVAAASLAGVSGIEQVNLAAGTNSIAFNDAFAAANAALLAVYGASGDDTIDASADTSTIRAINTLSFGGNDTLKGGAGNDIFRFNVGDLTAADVVQGGSGTDVLAFLGAGTVAAASLAGVSGIEQVNLAAGTNSIAFNDAFAAANAALLAVYGASGDDTIDASADTSTIRAINTLSFGGNDTLKGGAGNDIFRFNVGDLTGADVVQGGGGIDTLTFLNAGTVAAASLAGVSGIEQIVLASGTNSVTFNDTFANANATTLLVVGSSGDDTVNASADTATTRAITVKAAAGNDTLKGGAGNDTFRFNVGDLTAADVVQGGGGTDTLSFANAGTVGAASLAGVSGIEQITLAAGTNSIAFNDTFANANATTLRVSGTSGNDTIDASADTSTTHGVGITAGAGNDTLKGGAGNDGFRFAAGDLTAADVVQGGGGNDTLIFTNAVTVAAASLAGVSGIEQIVLASGTNSIAFNDTFANANAATLTIFGSIGDDTIDASADTATNRAINVQAGAGNDTLKGGAGNDTFRGGGGLDTMTGGNGNDTFVFDTAIGVSALGTITDFTVGADMINLDRHIFGAVGADGLLAASVFESGASELNASTRVFYNSGTGDIFYDTDGAGGVAAVKFAHVNAGMALTASSFTAIN